MTITEFAKSRHIQPQAVQRYLSRHKDLKDQCVKVGKTVEIPPAVEAALTKKYPLPVIEYIDNPETLTELRETKAKLEATLAKCVSLEEDLRAKEQRIAEQDKQILLIEQQTAKIDALEAELAAEKNKTWWQKLWKR